jgi:Carboxypeptidase regulatory-like domain/TonB dependent receptor
VGVYKRPKAVLIAFAMACLQVVAWGQLYTGSITGIVSDASGTAVMGATVTLSDSGRGFRQTTKTDVSGRYLFQSLPPREYTLQVENPGFDLFELKNIGVEANGRLSVDAKLRIPARKESVSVQESTAPARPEDATVGLTLTRQLINDLPLVTRNPFDLAFLTPGVSQAPGVAYGNGVSTPGFITNFVSDGSRNAQADVLLDGVSVANSDNNPGVQKALYVPPVEAIEEYTVQQASFSAEFGNSGGTIVNVVTRSGSNGYHGELFEYFRNNVLNANTFFANAAGLRSPHLTRNDFGGTLGGPVIKNRTFFFFDFNGIRALTGATSNLAGVPDTAERAGDFGELCARAKGTFDPSGVCSNPAGQIYDPYTGTPNSQNNAVGRTPIPFNNLATYVSPGNAAIPFGLGSLPAHAGNLIDPVGAKLIQAFPLPNLNVGTAAYDPYHNWVSQGANVLNQQSFDIKLDHRFNDRNRLSVKFSHEWDFSQNANFFGTVYDTNTQGPTKHAALLGAVNYTHVFTPSTLATISLGYGHNWNPTDGVAASFGGFDPAKVLGLPSNIDSSGFLTPPSVSISGSYGCNGFNGCIGGQAFSVLRFASETGHLVGSVDHIVGKHQIKIGGELRRHRINCMQAGAPNGLFTFNASGTAAGTTGVGGDALAALMIGYVDASSRYDIPAFTATQSFQTGGFIQDNWRVTTKLTLNLGLRYDVETPRTERYNQMTYFNPSAASPLTIPGLNLNGAVEFTGQNGNPRTEFNTYWAEWGPRFGFAYRIFDNTTLRGGYGIYYDPSDLGVVGNAVTGGFLGYSASTPGVNNVPSSPWLPLEFLRNPFPYGIQPPTGNAQGSSTLLGQALSGIPVRNLNQTPQEQTWSFDVQHRLPGSILLDAGYIGRKGTHLYAMGYGNQFDALPPDVANALRANPSFYLQQVANPFQGYIQGSADLSGATIPRWKLYVPFPQYSSGSTSGISSNFAPWANSIYNSVQLRLEKRFSHGMQFLFSYTFQKSLDDASIGSSGYSFLVAGGAVTETVARDPNNLRLDRSLSSFSIPQIAQLSFTYQLPFGRGKYLGGWQVNGIYRVDNGLPVELFLCSGCSVSVPTYGNQYPDLLAPLNVAGTGNLNQYFANPGAAVKPAAYTDGSAPRVLPNARIPGTDNLTASLFKQYPLRFEEGAKLEVRLEAFNVLNYVQFAAPDSKVGDATFGKITAQANQPRQVQIGLKVYF